MSLPQGQKAEEQALSGVGVRSRTCQGVSGRLRGVASFRASVSPPTNLTSLGAIRTLTIDETLPLLVAVLRPEMDAECCGHAKILAVFCIYGSPNFNVAPSKS